MRQGTLNQRRYRSRLKQRLYAMLENVCALCGSEDDLEIDHEHGRDWEPNRVWSDARLRKYIQEAAEGHVRLLCRSCNAVYRPAAAEDGSEGF